ncbi:methyl-accepting chemotaxis sensory transducer with TarH sensor /methyl-accepting chemotaxis sensory transducer with Pas/Pac sensor [Rhodopseudomonas thermotolerans]|uniref:Methyl-accepting chemotaxis sensory transducer with TarH sensor /methyl-accepting chemotaxis sensory transducer with Pas/Pac sensor n=2 Tax=Rhodopseudomonas TaxID=1073 RepID=A0A336JZ53_9BRAD|nr:MULTISPECIES: methyl-accepting chemotaxis protein [Rhodopseudomonas]RED21879.1 methyl-accepting chemotaxis sensory transducer with TarH sensor /methyl-accepting chemotaxis sensory transducer with Pas/Pac sensor [Rhodopseudomonas pentothenatexigens]REF88645.1 methyl-accepting chemotaxis sensory transducer with TarH sensor /methyl-accepting chemotaxis sensory transducer with Pas/Pac sensor [Rhodopseudomonas thermotolerans]SSW93569.1 methyl-accepting chemotaxis sensory transducer with TarH senso
MRKNLPVTSDEHVLEDGTLIVSKTDLKGKLTYFNDQFVAASGFSEQELIGQPHNIVRHPDMPVEAFQNLWDTLKAGRPWVGAVKNRRKNGGFYWVLASATPLWENGEVTGYMSVRTKLPADQRAEAEHVYALLRDNKAHGYKIDDGIIRRRSWRDRFSIFTRTLKARLTSLVTVQAVLLVVVGAVGLWSTRDANLRLSTMFGHRVMPLEQLYVINDRMLDNAMALSGAALLAKAGQQVPDLTQRIETNSKTLLKTIADYLAADLSPEERRLADSFVERRRAYGEQATRPGLQLLRDGKIDELSALVTGKGRRLYDLAKADLDGLVAIQMREGGAEYDAAQLQYARLWAISLVLLTLGLLLGILNGRSTIRAITVPIGRLNTAMSNISQSKFDSRIVVDCDDEIGVALRNIQAMQNQLYFTREEEKDAARRIALQRKLDMQRLAGEFEAAVGEIIETVSSASTELEASAGTLTGTAERSQGLTVAVAAASEQAASNVQSVASATEQMSSSVHEISRQVQESARIAIESVAQARHTNDRVSELSQAAGRIGAVVELINNIAGQTNLLALNATIEAARAGEAGRGFAVVAQEVKALAEQTAKATGDISQQIAGIQAGTEESVAAIRQIGVTIDRMAEIASTVASAVEQQGAATQEIARNVQKAAHGTMEVSSNVASVQQGAAETGSAASQVLSAARALSQDSNRLKAEVSRFLDTVRAA